MFESTVCVCVCVWGGHSFKEQNFEDMIEIIAQRWLLYNVMMFESTVLGKGILLKSKT